MADLVLGPLLRYVDDRRATIWVETDAACEVAVLGHRQRTFEVEGHHYALVVVDGLEPGTNRSYEVHLDGERVWPLHGWSLPSSVIRTPAADRPLRIAFGSCHVAAPAHVVEVYGADALAAYGLELAARAPADRPDLLALMGDQVYADEAAPETRRRVRERSPANGGDHPPDDQVGDFEEYTWLYHEAWSEPAVRWLLSTVPTTMVFDDHDVIDDWNTSAAWREEMARTPWWEGREVGGLMAYWLYQHLGNLTPEALAADELLAREVVGEGALRAAMEADRRRDEARRWSFVRELAGSARVRVVNVDVRNSRDLDGDERAIVRADRWAEVDAELRGDCDHLVVVASLPWLLPGGVADVERWDEAVCGGAWGRFGRRLGERMRRQADLEHWPAYSRSFDALTDALVAVARGERGAAPASVLVLGGDVHFSYVAPVTGGADGARSAIVQLVSSPLRSRVPARMRRQLRLANSRLGALFGRLLVRTVPGRRPSLRWATTAGPWFGNGIATLTLDGGSAAVRFERMADGELVELHEGELT